MYKREAHLTKWESTRKVLDQWIDEETRRAFQLWAEDITRPVYIWYKPSNEAQWGGFRVGLDAPGPEWKLAVTTRLSLAHRDYDHLRRTLHEILYPLPVLPTVLA